MNEISEDSAMYPRVPWGQFLPLLLLLTAAILLATWPWAKTFASGVIAHWDPPFHAWKLEFAARQILEGRLLPVDGNTNMYYPNSGAFYYEALHWPQAVFAALLFGLTDAGPVLVCHVTLVFFWALSGACLWALLRALGVRRVASVAGALLFTLMPYRIAYRVEFNMQLCFAIPLFYFFLVRYFQRPGIGYACGLAVAWWLQAVSELYQAVFLLLMLPFPVLALMSGRWALLRSWRRFWAPATAAAAFGGLLSAIWLLPYVVILRSQTLVRGLGEIQRHVLEPLSYLVPYGTSGFFNGINARRDELDAYPTLALILLALAFLVFRRMDRRKRKRACGERLLRGGRTATLLLFAAIATALYGWPIPGVAPLYVRLPVLACLLSLLLHALPGRRRSVREALMEGLFSAAVFSFFMSLGPRILGTSTRFSAPNLLFLSLYDWLDALKGFRVVSRFSFFVLFWMVMGSAFAIDRLLRARTRSRRAASIATLAALGIAFVSEIRPTRDKTILPLPCPVSSTVLDNLERRPDPYVLAIVPLGHRTEDSQHMLQVARHNRLSVYAWGGTYPPYTQRVGEGFIARSEMSAREAAELLRQLWPECLILEDKLFSRRASMDYATRFADEADVVDEDSRYALLRLRPCEEPASERIRLVRHDYLVRNPDVVFTASAGDPEHPGNVWLDVNGVGVGRFPLTRQEQTFRVALPPSLFIKPAPNQLRFRTDAPGGFALRSFALRPADPATSAAQTIRLPEAWSPFLDQLPETALALDATYPGGLTIVGVEPPPPSVRPGEDFQMRCYVRLPKRARALRQLALKAGLTRDGGVLFESGKPLSQSIDLNLFQIQSKQAIHAVDIPVHVPSDFESGESYGLALTIRDERGRRHSGRDSDGRKIRRLHLPFSLSLTDSPLTSEKENPVQ